MAKHTEPLTAVESDSWAKDIAALRDEFATKLAEAEMKLRVEVSQAFEDANVQMKSQSALLTSIQKQVKALTPAPSSNQGEHVTEKKQKQMVVMGAQLSQTKKRKSTIRKKSKVSESLRKMDPVDISQDTADGEPQPEEILATSSPKVDPMQIPQDPADGEPQPEDVTVVDHIRLKLDYDQAKFAHAHNHDADDLALLEPVNNEQQENTSWIELKEEMLHTSNMYNVSKSIWDALLFAFTDYTSTDVSIALLTVYILNAFVQVTFIYSVYSYMLVDPVSPDMLTALLKFRAGVAHEVSYADKANMRSMAQQICEEDNKLHLSGVQSSLYSNVKQFYSGALGLVLLAQLMWTVTCFGDLQNNYRFCCTLLSMRRGSRTIIMTDCQSTANEADPSLLSTKVVLKLAQISHARMVAVCLLVVMPRFLIAVVLCVVGTFYLSVTVSMGSLLFSAMALSFFLNLDEFFYAVFAPRHIQLLHDNMEPTPIIPRLSSRSRPGCTTFGKILIVAVYVMIVYIAVVRPFFFELLQAQEILCSGSKDFVVAEHKTGILYAARTGAETSLTDAEKGVIQLTQMTLHEQSAWVQSLKNNMPEVSLLVKSNQTYAKIHGRGSPQAIPEAKFDPDTFRYMTGLSAMTMKESNFLPCRDLEAAPNPEAAMTMLRTAVGRHDIPLCDSLDDAALQFWQPHCSNLSLNLVRTLCPITCNCHKAVGDGFGAYQHPDFGCPTQCASARSVAMAYDSMHSVVSDSCADLPAAAFNVQGSIFPMQDWFPLYITTVRDYLMSRPGYEANLVHNANQYALYVSASMADMSGEELSEHLLDHKGGFWDQLAARQWSFLPGYNTVFGKDLEGCAFLTSADFKWLFSHDLCDESTHFSMRLICPVSCGCGTMAGCPESCRHNVDNLPCVDDAHADGEVVSESLSYMFGENVTSCKNISHASLIDLCWRQNMTLLRRLCPISCRCHDLPSFYAGFFTLGAWGCAAACNVGQRTHVLSDDIFGWHTDELNWTGAPCENRPSWWWQKDYGQMFAKRYLWGMVEYMQAQGLPLRQSVERQLDGYYYGWGERAVVDDDDYAEFTLDYYIELIKQSDLGLDFSAIAGYIIEGGWVDAVVDGQYEIIPGMRLLNWFEERVFSSDENYTDRGYTRVQNFCDFMLHLNFMWFTGIDPCSVNKHQTLRFLCPESCNCVSQYGCPRSCAGRQTSAHNFQEL
eukprot:TRINITY_DN101327_c0_g1_i1.p1 TRINITY_DN101327_c0_g1~~TRINITY_DN101327_c0_g1_i1.p1  ORF type:complete len:1204 (+),score=137.74 TRINITY_DN101327_c0_g1_i1:60-3671(+)